MDRLRALYPKYLPFHWKKSDDSNDLYANDPSSSLNLEMAPPNDAVGPKRKHSIMRSRSTVTLSDSEIPNKFKELFDKKSPEVLLKRYKCTYTTGGVTTQGKIYISSNFLCFVEGTHKNLQLILRLADVGKYITSESEVAVYTAGQVHVFADFNSDSGVPFLTNYLRLTNKPTAAPSVLIATQSSPKDSFSSLSISSSKSSLPRLRNTSAVAPPRHTQPGSSKSSVLHLSTGSAVSVGSAPIKQSSSSSALLPSPPRLQSPKSPATSNQPQSSTPRRRRQSPPPPPPPPTTLLPSSSASATTLGLSLVSDVAFRASCIPLLILTRLLAFLVSMATKVSPSGLPSLAAPLGLGAPPRSLTRNTALVVMCFLGVSVLYLYLRVETMPVNGTPVSAAVLRCEREYRSLLDSVRLLADSLQRIEARLAANGY